jgi:hypothetical protein
MSSLTKEEKQYWREGYTNQEITYLIDFEKNAHTPVTHSLTPVDLSTLPENLKTAYLDGEKAAMKWF